MTGKRIRPTNDFVYCRKCVKDHVRGEDGKVLIYRTDNDLDGDELGRGFWFEIIAVGPKCRYVQPSDVGSTTLLPEMESGMYRLGPMEGDVDGRVVPNEDFCIHEPVLIRHFPAILESRHG